MVVRKRKHISLTTKLAATLLTLHPQDREHAKNMTEAQYISLFQFDHAELWALEGGDHFTNLTPLLIAPHRQKSKRDTSIVAKVRRIEPKWREFTKRMASPRKAKQKSKWAGRKIQSRGFK